LSGDHSPLGTISGIKSVYPTKRLGVVWIDACHIHSPYTSSGNIHGMLSAALGEDNFDCQVNEINPDTDFKNIMFMALK
jgi:arginase